MKYLYIYVCVFLLLSCDKLVYEKDFIDKGNFEIIVEKDNALADDYSETKITITLPKDTQADSRKITISTTMGKFAGEDKKVIEIVSNKDGIVVCKLISPQKSGKALLTATVSNLNVSITKEITFLPANPENIYLAFTSKTDSTATVALKSSREKGKVSEDLKVVFEINPANDKVIFDPNNKTDVSGGATTNIIFPKTYKGTIKATVGTLTSKEYSIK